MHMCAYLLPFLGKCYFLRIKMFTIKGVIIGGYVISDDGTKYHIVNIHPFCNEPCYVLLKPVGYNCYAIVKVYLIEVWGLDNITKGK